MIQLSCLGDSSEDGEWWILRIDNSIEDRPINILYGSILKLSSVLNYLPDHFNIPSDELMNHKRFKGSRRQPVVMKGCEDDVYIQNPEQPEGFEFSIDDEEDKQSDIFDEMPLGRYGDADLKYAEKGIDYTTVNGKPYIKGYIRYDIRSLNMIDVKEIDVVLVSNYNNIYALPFIWCHPDFKGKVLITEPLHQIGKFLCTELVEMDNHRKERHQRKAKDDDEMSLKDEYLVESELNDIFEYLKYELWCEMYTLEDIEKTFDEMWTVLHYNQEIESISPLKISPISSGHHLGSCNWIINHTIFDK